MACMTSEKSPLAQKRCSLPGPGGALNLYSTHQQRRLSERGLMIYKPNKPDIDLIRDFTNANNQRKHSTPNFALYPGGAGPSCSSAMGTSGGLKYAHGTFGSLSQLNRNFHGSSAQASASAGPSPSSYRRNSSLASFSSYSSSATPSSYVSEGVVLPGSGTCANNTNANGAPFSSTQSPTGAIGGSARKVRIRIQKNPGAMAGKYVELHSVGKRTVTTSASVDEEYEGGLEGDEMTESERSLFLRSPLFDSRRFSDSAVCRGLTTPAITFSLTPDTGGDDDASNNPTTILRRASDSAGIVLSTGDLEVLKCLTSSAQEISTSSGTTEHREGAASPTNLGNRSKSFDATLSLPKKGQGSSWFARRHLPISYKLPASSPTSAGSNQPLRTPILTITNENECKELIEIPSPPTVTPVSSGGSPNEVAATVTWDKNGYVLDAALLGSAIENHLKQGNRKRRATFSTLYQAPPSSVECKVTTRARSASACVIPINPKELAHGSTGNPGSHRRESISTDRVIPNFPLSEKVSNRRSSLKSMVRFPWDSGKDVNSPESKSLLWESPVEYTNSGSFIRTTVTDFGADCIDEEDEECKAPEAATNSSTSPASNNRGAFVVNIDPTSNGSNKESTTSSSAPNTANAKKGFRGFELPSSSKGKVTTAGDRDMSGAHSHSAPASPKPTTKRGSESNISICSAIRDFIIHSIRS